MPLPKRSNSSRWKVFNNPGDYKSSNREEFDAVGKHNLTTSIETDPAR